MLASFKSDVACRVVQILVSDTPYGRFIPLTDKPITPQNWECLDGTLYIDKSGNPYMIFCHEWVQVHNGEIYAVKLSRDLKCAVSEPFLLFKASEPVWAPKGKEDYVTDGPFMYRTESGGLCKPEFVGWGGLLPIPALIETVLGINVNVPENTVTLDISADEYGGIKNLDFGGGKISVICREYDPENGKYVIETGAEKEFTLRVRTELSQKETALTVEIGKHLYNLKISGV